MTCRPSTIAALLFVSAVLASQSVGAAPITAGDPGTADGLVAGPVTLPAGQTLPSPAAPTARTQPMHAPDKASLYKAYATLTHTPDGKTTVIPASAKLRAVIDEEFATDLNL
jgi:hypothetical protein